MYGEINNLAAGRDSIFFEKGETRYKIKPGVDIHLFSSWTPCKFLVNLLTFIKLTALRIVYLNPELNNLNFHPLVVGSRYSDPQSA